MSAIYEVGRDNDKKAHVILCHTGCAPHFHSSFEILYIIDGEFEVTINDKSMTMHAGDVAVSLDCDIHSYLRGKQKGKYYVLLIPPTYTAEFLENTKTKKPENPFIRSGEITEEILHCFNKIGKGQDNYFLVLGYVNVVFGLIQKGICFSENPMSSSETVLPLKIVSYLSEHYTEDVTLAGIARELGYNSYYISKFFNRYFNCSFTEYVNMLRLRRFLGLQQGSTRNITENALQCGFGCIRTFNRAFKKQFGLSPKEYIERDKQLLS